MSSNSKARVTKERVKKINTDSSFQRKEERNESVARRKVRVPWQKRNGQKGKQNNSSDKMAAGLQQEMGSRVFTVSLAR
jgi:hypothetical protein